MVPVSRLTKFSLRSGSFVIPPIGTNWQTQMEQYLNQQRFGYWTARSTFWTAVAPPERRWRKCFPSILCFFNTMVTSDGRWGNCSPTFGYGSSGATTLSNSREKKRRCFWVQLHFLSSSGNSESSRWEILALISITCQIKLFFLFTPTIHNRVSKGNSTCKHRWNNNRTVRFFCLLKSATFSSLYCFWNRKKFNRLICELEPIQTIQLTIDIQDIYFFNQEPNDI